MLKHKTSQSQSTEEDKFKLKHQSLLQDFLEFQKEFVSKKKKLQMTKQKRDILSTEIRNPGVRKQVMNSRLRKQMMFTKSCTCY
ncbi:uncharacterized protein LOC110612406 isoform X2 [Manihot esculenta]|uniref:uncharacterized protein LOC110612406 isoform X2 n=1 Tax=Manihot esculenta TaxID=3983 RepID=UPI001CC6298B|nr:uncharacterized protein LOC110612406 isoform X2 [Manihot esculenta]